MTYDDVLNELKNKICKAVPGVDIHNFDTSKSFKEMGANSIILVDIISRVMRDLKIDAPGPELLAASNIDELIKILVKYSNVNS